MDRAAKKRISSFNRFRLLTNGCDPGCIHQKRLAHTSRRARVGGGGAFRAQIDRVCAHNWRRGTCSHDLLFQAADPIQHLAWVGDQLAFGTSGGGNWIIDRTTGFVVNVFEGHSGDVTGASWVVLRDAKSKRGD